MKRAAFLGWLQVSLVSLNTYQIANGKALGALFVGFLIALIWTSNVRNVVQSGWWVRIAYAFGASLGALTGIHVASAMY